MRRKCSASSCSMVPTVTPRLRCERNLTHSNSALGSRWKSVPLIMRLNSSQVWFCVSQTSVVSAPRTARAFSRAARRQLAMLEKLDSSRTMKSMTFLALKSWYFSRKPQVSSLMLSRPRQPCSASSADCGSSEVW